MKTITDDQIAEIEALAEESAFECCGNYDVGGEYMGQQERICCLDPHRTESEIKVMAEDILALITRLREAERWKADASQVLNQLLDYAYSLGLAKLGHSVTESLIEDHKRLREAERDAARYRWLRSRLVGASFDWGEEGTTVLAFEMPPSLSIGADCDRNIDEAMMSAREAAE